MLIYKSRNLFLTGNNSVSRTMTDNSHKVDFDGRQTFPSKALSKHGIK